MYKRQALVYLFMASSQQNQDEYITTLNDFLEQYPNSADGYIRLSLIHISKWGNVNERRNQLHEVIRLSGMNLIIDDTDHPLIIKVCLLYTSRRFHGRHHHDL